MEMSHVVKLTPNLMDLPRILRQILQSINQSNGRHKLQGFKKKKPNKVKIRHYILFDNMQTSVKDW